MPRSHNGGEIHRTLVVGLTGGIGSGKSTVAALFERFDVPVIDADVLARTLVAPDKPALQDIIEAFGPGSVDAGGRLDRDRLRRRVFSDPAARERLEAILHPRIRGEIIAWTSSIRAPYCIAVIPLLLETGQDDLVDRILVVDTRVDTQIERAARRDGLSRQEIDAVLATQATREYRLAAADEVITNDGQPDELEAQVRTLHEKYLALARIRTG
jgi:dephospho-CoA kinase